MISPALTRFYQLIRKFAIACFPQEPGMPAVGSAVHFTTVQCPPISEDGNDNLKAAGVVRNGFEVAMEPRTRAKITEMRWTTQSSHKSC
jgi:hypothetical protein